MANFMLTAKFGGVDMLENSAPDSGECFICNVTSTKKCLACSASMSGRDIPFYCGKEHQAEDWPRHKLNCLKTRNSKIKKALSEDDPQRPVYGLVQCVGDDRLPAPGSPCYDVFGFSKCQTEQDEANLLSVYVALIQLFETDIDDLEEAATNGQLSQMICQEFETLRPHPDTRGRYYFWFLQNKHLVQ